jgi:hypothetical protein
VVEKQQEATRSRTTNDPMPFDSRHSEFELPIGQQVAGAVIFSLDFKKNVGWALTAVSAYVQPLGIALPKIR